MQFLERTFGYTTAPGGNNQIGRFLLLVLDGDRDDRLVIPFVGKAYQHPGTVRQRRDIDKKRFQNLRDVHFETSVTVAGKYGTHGFKVHEIHYIVSRHRSSFYRKIYRISGKGVFRRIDACCQTHDSKVLTMNIPLNSLLFSSPERKRSR